MPKTERKKARDRTITKLQSLILGVLKDNGCKEATDDKKSCRVVSTSAGITLLGEDDSWVVALQPSKVNLGAGQVVRLKRGENHAQGMLDDGGVPLGARPYLREVLFEEGLDLVLISGSHECFVCPNPLTSDEEIDDLGDLPGFLVTSCEASRSFSLVGYDPETLRDLGT